MIDEREIIATTIRSGPLHEVMVAVKDEGEGKWIAKIGCGGVMDSVTASKIVADKGAELNKKEALVFFPGLDPELCINKE